jgi:hypothetical protein
MRNGRNYFACEEREQPIVRALTRRVAFECRQEFVVTHCAGDRW